MIGAQIDTVIFKIKYSHKLTLYQIMELQPVLYVYVSDRRLIVFSVQCPVFSEIPSLITGH